jgi:hypothetical protein
MPTLPKAATPGAGAAEPSGDGRPQSALTALSQLFDTAAPRDGETTPTLAETVVDKLLACYWP